MLQIHQILANAALYILVLLALWGILAGLFNRSVGGGYRATYVLTLALFGVQDLVGIVQLISGLRPLTFLHFIYGIVPFVTLPGGLVFSSGVTARRESLTLGLVALFTFGLVIRATMTGAPR